MKAKLLHSIAVTIIFCCSISVKADTNDSTTQSEPTKVDLKSENLPIPSKGRPKAPSRQHIECWYINGELTFDFVIPEGICTLSLTDYSTGFTTQYTFDSANHADIPVGPLPNGGLIEILTQSGNSYYGYIKFE